MAAPITPHSIPTTIVSKPNPTEITVGPDGNIWFTDGGGAIGVVNDTHLVATVPLPLNVTVNSPFGFTVTDVYTSGLVDKAFNGNVTIVLASNPGGAGTVLGGTAAVLAVNGVATFSGLTLNHAGVGYILSASSTATNGPTSANTVGFNVVNVAPPPPPPPAPTIIGDKKATIQKVNKKGKKVGKPVFAGYTITFSLPMDQTTLASTASYQIGMFVKAKKPKQPPVLKLVRFSVTQVTSNSVTLKARPIKSFQKEAGSRSLPVGSRARRRWPWLQVAYSPSRRAARGSISPSLGRHWSFSGAPHLRLADLRSVVRASSGSSRTWPTMRWVESSMRPRLSSRISLARRESSKVSRAMDRKVSYGLTL